MIVKHKFEQKPKYTFYTHLSPQLWMWNIARPLSKISHINVRRTLRYILYRKHDEIYIWKKLSSFLLHFHWILFLAFELHFQFLLHFIVTTLKFSEFLIRNSGFWVVNCELWVVSCEFRLVFLLGKYWKRITTGLRLSLLRFFPIDVQTFMVLRSLPKTLSVK